jgi:hypothetical protein
MMALLHSKSEIVCQFLQALGIQTDRLKSVTIHIEPDEAIKADCWYYVIEPPFISVEEIETYCKKMELKFKEIQE